MTRLSDLTAEQRCVMNNAIDEGDLRSLIAMWNPEAPAPRDDDIHRLGAAVLDLLDQDLLKVYPVTTGAPPFARDEVVKVLGHRPAWEWVVDDGVDDDEDETPTVVWTVLTEAGRAVMSTGTSEELGE
jgi:hypothetical protein